MKKENNVANVESSLTDDTVIELIKYFGTYIIDRLLEKRVSGNGQWDKHQWSFNLKPFAQSVSKSHSRKK